MPSSQVPRSTRLTIPGVMPLVMQIRTRGQSRASWPRNGARKWQATVSEQASSSSPLGPPAPVPRSCQAAQLGQDPGAARRSSSPWAVGCTPRGFRSSRRTPELGLQGLDLPGDGRLGAEQPDRGPAEVAFLAYDQEGFEQLDVHHAFLAYLQ